MPVQFQWYTRGNPTTNINQDYGGVVEYDEAMVAIVADGISRKPDSGKLAEALVNLLVNRAGVVRDLPNPEEISQWLAEATISLRTAKLALNASVSYLVAGLKNGNLSYIVYAGDCRIGQYLPNKKIAWLNSIHSVATAISPIPDEQLIIVMGRNILTRAFTCRRHRAPTTEKWSDPMRGTFVIGTDGFWALTPVEEQVKSIELVGECNFQAADDVSRLVINPYYQKDPELNPGENFFFHRAER